MPAENAGLISPSAAGEINRARVVRALYDTGPLSRAELARLTGVTRATIGTIVQGMIDQNLLAEGQARASSSSGGKPSRPLWFSPHAPPMIAAHLLPGSVETALISAGGEVLTTEYQQFDADSPDDATATLLAGLRRVMAQHSGPSLGVGIAVGGMVDTATGTIVNIALAPKLSGLAIGPAVSEEFGLPVWIDLHPRVQALGDRWFGQARGHDSFASVYTGEALGVGLVLGGLVQRGAGGSGGEAGHTTVDLHGQPCRCGRIGCWETIATHTWLREQALHLGLPGAAAMTAGPLSRLAAAGHADATALLDTYADNLTVGLANLHQIFAPGLFILHGDAVAAGEALRGRVEARLRAAVPPHPSGPPQVAFTTLDDRATLLGAAGLVLSHSLQMSW